MFLFIDSYISRLAPHWAQYVQELQHHHAFVITGDLLRFVPEQLSPAFQQGPLWLFTTTHRWKMAQERQVLKSFFLRAEGLFFMKLDQEEGHIPHGPVLALCESRDLLQQEILKKNLSQHMDHCAQLMEQTEAFHDVQYRLAQTLEQFQGHLKPLAAIHEQSAPGRREKKFGVTFSGKFFAGKGQSHDFFDGIFAQEWVHLVAVTTPTHGALGQVMKSFEELKLRFLREGTHQETSKYWTQFFKSTPLPAHSDFLTLNLHYKTGQYFFRSLGQWAVVSSHLSTTPTRNDYPCTSAFYETHESQGHLGPGQRLMIASKGLEGPLGKDSLYTVLKKAAAAPRIYDALNGPLLEAKKKARHSGPWDKDSSVICIEMGPMQLA